MLVEEKKSSERDGSRADEEVKDSDGNSYGSDLYDTQTESVDSSDLSEEENNKHQKQKLQKLMFRHNSPVRMKWDLAVMSLAIYNCLSIPFDAAFSPEANFWYDLFETFVDICFAVDIIVNFRTTFINSNSGLEVTNIWKIAYNYIKGGRFMVDLLASVPFERIYEILNPSSGDSETLKLLGLLKLIRLLRLQRVIRYMKFKTGLKIGLRII